MNSTWFPAFVTAIGLFINLVWTALNVQMRNDIARQVSDLKLWMAKEYVSEKVCLARMDIPDAQPTR